MAKNPRERTDKKYQKAKEASGRGGAGQREKEAAAKKAEKLTGVKPGSLKRIDPSVASAKQPEAEAGLFENFGGAVAKAREGISQGRSHLRSRNPLGRKAGPGLSPA